MAKPEHLEPLVVVREDLSPPDGRDYFTDPQLPGRKPTFSTQEVSKVFFGHQALWLRLLVEEDWGIDIPRTKTGNRRFQLHHVELLSHAFLKHGRIDLKTFANCTLIIRSIANNYRL